MRVILLIINRRHLYSQRWRQEAWCLCSHFYLLSAIVRRSSAPSIQHLLLTLWWSSSPLSVPLKQASAAFSWSLALASQPRTWHRHTSTSLSSSKSCQLYPSWWVWSPFILTLLLGNLAYSSVECFPLLPAVRQTSPIPERNESMASFRDSLLVSWWTGTLFLLASDFWNQFVSFA